MKIDFEGVTRVLDLEHVKLRHAMAVQEFTGLAVLSWQERLAGIGGMTEADFKADPAATLKKAPLFTDPAWILSVAAAHWLMLAQAGEDPPPLDDDYDCDVLGFYLAFMTTVAEEAKAKRVPDQPDPTARPGRPAQSSRRTADPKTLEAVPLPPPTGS